VAGSLAATWLIYLAFFGVVDRPTQTFTPDGASVQSGPCNLVVFRVAGAIIFVWLALALVTAIRIGRNDAPRFEDLSAAEQTRRREAGELLKHPKGQGVQSAGD